MLQSLELENFKAFGERARIPFAPITLIFGENSAGKSTILQALYLLKQTSASREAGALLLPRTEDGIVDLGSFQEMLFDHDLKRTLSIRVDTKLDQELAIEFSFRRPSLESEVLLDQIGIYDGKSAKCIAKFQPSGTTLAPQDLWMMGSFHDLRGLSPEKLAAVKCVWLTKNPEYWKRELEWFKENKEDVISKFEEDKWFLEEYLSPETDEEDIMEEGNSNERKLSDEEIQENYETGLKNLDFVNDNIEFFSSDFDLETYISKMYEEEMSTVLGMKGFFPVGVVSEEMNGINRWIKEPRSLLPQGYGDMTFGIGHLATKAGYMLEQVLANLFHMGPSRRPPERWYIFTGTSPQHVGSQGDSFADLIFRRPELVKETNEWLEKLNMGHKLTVKSMGADSGDLFEVRLIDTRRNARVSVALPDVGFGVSQLLPFIVQSLLSEKQIISIEQPEVHVHPKLQADLGDLLAAAIKKDRPNQFIVETHSEHLILRLQRLVRKQQIKPEDVSVIYVSRGPEGANAERLRLDEEGDFIDEWPNGFFPERLRELR
jgi:hypothetical protein